MQLDATVEWNTGSLIFLRSLAFSTITPGFFVEHGSDHVMLHHMAHQQYYIANSLKTDMRVEAVMR
jgi:hypothetical protein